jgi:hypothetical protein
MPAPARSIHLRTTFDGDPTAYVGRFVPDSIAPDELDENAAAQTRCSRFFKVKVVDVNQEVDETMYASRQAMASLGIPPIASAQASQGNASTLRVKYVIKKKIQVETDADQLDACCRADKSQCTGTIIGEFVFGSGEIMQAVDAKTKVAGEGAHPAAKAGAGYEESSSWKRVRRFDDMFFAFQTTKTPLGLGGGATSTSDCSWCDQLPGSLDGKYFCGVSPDAPSEAMARDLAMRSAREQVVKYLGELLETQSSSKASVVKGVLDDQQVVTAMASGVASRVKDERWCPAREVPTPDGARYRSRVLAFFPEAQSKPAARDAIRTIIETRKAAGKLTPEQQTALEQLGEGFR